MAEHTAERVAKELKYADSVLIGAGAGMGVDSGLPDIRGIDGLWKEVSPMQGQLLAEEPVMSWGFFAHCLELFRTNIDRHFQESGFPEEKILKEHGSIYL